MKTNKLCFVLLGACLFCTNLYSQIVPQIDRVEIIGSNSFELGEKVAIDSANNLYVFGLFGSTVDFDDGPGTSELTATGFLDAFVAKYDNHGKFEWVRQFECSGTINAHTLTVDKSGALILSGTFSTSAVFDPTGSGSVSITNGSADIFVVKLSLDGDFVWANTYVSSASDQPYDAVVDNNQDIYITGVFSDTIDFNPNGSPIIRISDAFYSHFTFKLDNLGNTLWVQTYLGDGNSSIGKSLSCDENNNIYLSGEFQTLIDFGQGGIPLTGNNIKSIFIQKIQPDGTILWSRKIAGTIVEEVQKTTYNFQDHSLYIIGRFSGTVDFDPGISTDSHSSINNSTDIFITKWDTSGNSIWLKTYGGPANDNIQNLNFTNSNELLITGPFTDTLDLDPEIGVFNVVSNGDQDLYYSKFDSNGNFIGAFSQGGALGDRTEDFFMDSDGAIYCFGYFKGTVDFDPSNDSLLLSSNGQFDIFVQKFYDCLFLDSTENLANVLSVQNGAVSYQWIDCGNGDSIITGENGSMFTPVSNGSYACVIDFGGCMDTTSCSVVSTIGLDDVTQLNDFKIFPIPFHDMLIIEIEDWDATSVTLFDAFGKGLARIEKLTSSSYQWNLPHLEKGVYFVELKTGSNQQIVKVIHQ